jgi:predicted nucleic acid-binding protein
LAPAPTLSADEDGTDMPARYDRRRATVVAFDQPGWAPPEAVVIDTNIVAEMLLSDEPEHSARETVIRRLAGAGSMVVFSRLLEMELWEVIFNHALRRALPRRDRRLGRFERRSRQAAIASLDRATRLWEDLLEELAWDCVELDEVADAVPDLMRAYGLQSYDAVHAATLVTSGVTDMVTRDAGFAVLMPEDATLHTTRRRDACGAEEPLSRPAQAGAL